MWQSKKWKSQSKQKFGENVYDKRRALYERRQEMEGSILAYLQVSLEGYTVRMMLFTVTVIRYQMSPIIKNYGEGPELKIEDVHDSTL